jgi:hypothetical protein
MLFAFDSMHFQSRVDFMTVSRTHSEFCVLLPACCTEYNKPLAAALYFSKELSRHGKGAAAILYFGNMVRCKFKSQP